MLNFMVGTAAREKLTAPAGHSFIFGKGGDDAIGGSPAHRNYLFGGDGDDYLNGGNRADTLFGGEGDDYFYGGGGRDSLFGGRGDDYLSGSDGNDKLWGGKGADTFAFTSLNKGADRILDFKPGRDTVYFFDIHVEKAELVYHSGTGRLVAEYADGSRDLIARMDKGLVLGDGDMIVG